MKTDPPEIVPNEALSSMSTAHLLELLDQETDTTNAAEINIAKITEITFILDDRAGVPPINVDAAYEEFMSDHLGSPMLYPSEHTMAKEESHIAVTPIRRRRPLVRLGLIAALFAVLLVGITITAYASGIDLLAVFARWTEDTFTFDVAADIPANSSVDPDSFVDIQAKLASDGITDIPVPKYIPEGYLFKALDTTAGQYTAVYEKDGKALIFQIHSLSSGNASLLEKSDGEPEIYIVKDIEHYIVSNLDRYSVAWVNEGYEYTIVGIPSMEDAYKMIDSIYRKK